MKAIKERLRRIDRQELAEKIEDIVLLYLPIITIASMYIGSWLGILN